MKKRVLSLPVLSLVLLLCAVFDANAFYNPTVGKWASRDPIAERGGLNLSAFVRNNPIAGVDRLGLVCSRSFSLSAPLLNALESAWTNSFNADGTMSEQGGSIIGTGNGGQQVRPGLPGTANEYPPGNFPPPAPGETLIGNYHTHPPSGGGWVGISFSPADIENLAYGARGDQTIVMAGSCIFVLTVDDRAKLKNCFNCNPKFKEAFQANPGLTPPQAVHNAVMQAIRDCGLCYYKVCRDQSGSFTNNAALQR